MNKKIIRKFVKINKFTVFAFSLIALVCVYVLGVNFYVIGSAQKQILSTQQLKTIEDVVMSF